MLSLDPGIHLLLPSSYNPDQRGRLHVNCTEPLAELYPIFIERCLGFQPRRSIMREVAAYMYIPSLMKRAVNRMSYLLYRHST